MPSEDDLYLARGLASAGNGVPLTIPYRQGDIFQVADLPPLTAAAEGHMVMLFMHPCTMRDGVGLQDWVNVVRVKKFGKGSSKDASRWEEGNFSEIPLRRLTQSKTTYIADMSAIWTLPSAELVRSRRIASLTDAGMIAIQHRLIFHLTRLAIDYRELSQANRALLAELEMQRGWVELSLSQATSSSMADIEAAEKEFDGFLGSNDRRPRLRNTESGEPQVRKEYNDACLKRFGSLPL